MYKKGILYIATGDRFREEAHFSARRVHQLMPEMPMALASDQFCDEEIFACRIPIQHPQGSFADKIAPLAKSPFEQTLFLDTDTYLCEAVPEIFELLQQYDVAMAHAPMRHTGSVDVPASFPEFNSGVIAYRMNDRTRLLFDNWARFYEEQVAHTGQIDDQPALRRALWNSDAKIAVLPPEYNFRFVLPSFAGRGNVKILHGRHHHLSDLEKRINRSGSPRVFLPRVRDALPRRFQFLSGPGILFGKFLETIALIASFFGSAFEAMKARLESKR